MNTKSVVIICLRVLAIYLFLQFVIFLPTCFSLVSMSRVFQADGSMETKSAFLPVVITIIAASLIYLGAGIFLLRKTEKVANFFVKDTGEQIHVSKPVSDSFLAVAFQCLGMYAIITWLPNLFYTLCTTILNASWTSSAPMTVSQRFSANWSALIQPITGTLLGLILIFKVSGIVRLISISRPMSKERAELDNTIPQPPEMSKGEK